MVSERGRCDWSAHDLVDSVENAFSFSRPQPLDGEPRGPRIVTVHPFFWGFESPSSDQPKWATIFSDLARF